MCPACFASTAMIVGSVFSAGGLTALTAKLVAVRKGSKSASHSDLNNFPDPQTPNTQSPNTQTKEKQS